MTFTTIFLFFEVVLKVGKECDVLKYVVKVSAVLLSVLFIMNNVYADDAYYTNNNGVSLTEREYNFFSEMYWDGFQEFVDDALYNRYLSRGLFDQEVHVVESLVSDQMMGTGASTHGLIHETMAKKLTLSYVCYQHDCTMVTTLDWKGDPYVKSYDVIGSLLIGNLTRLTTPITHLYWSNGSITFTDRVYSNNGWGCSVLLQNSSTTMKITQDVDVYANEAGTFCSSYQHAMSNISLETSKKYTLGWGGDGGIFFFYGSAVGKYDQMGGVSAVIS